MGKSNDPGQRVAGFRFSELMMNRIIWKDHFVAFTAVGFNYEVKAGGLHEKHVAETWQPCHFICRQENQAVSRMSVAGPSRYAPISSQQSGQTRRSQWPRGLRHEPSPPTRTLGSWVRIPLEAWMSVCIYSVCAVLYIGSGLTTG
jgi:hypothetical protein